MGSHPHPFLTVFDEGTNASALHGVCHGIVYACCLVGALGLDKQLLVADGNPKIVLAVHVGSTYRWDWFAYQSVIIALAGIGKEKSVVSRSNP